MTAVHCCCCGWLVLCSFARCGLCFGHTVFWNTVCRLTENEGMGNKTLFSESWIYLWVTGLICLQLKAYTDMYINVVCS